MWCQYWAYWPSVWLGNRLDMRVEFTAHTIITTIPYHRGVRYKQYREYTGVNLRPGALYLNNII